jgi:hypothetical protein
MRNVRFAIQTKTKQSGSNDAGAMYLLGIIISLEIQVSCRIGRRQSNSLNRQRNLDQVRRIVSWVPTMIMGDEEGQLPLFSCGYGLKRNCKEQPWLGTIEQKSGTVERALKHLTIAA